MQIRKYNFFTEDLALIKSERVFVSALLFVASEMIVKFFTKDLAAL